jgi:hypothetical protein
MTTLSSTPGVAGAPCVGQSFAVIGSDAELTAGIRANAASEGRDRACSMRSSIARIRDATAVIGS